MCFLPDFSLSSDQFNLAVINSSLEAAGYVSCAVKGQFFIELVVEAYRICFLCGEDQFFIEFVSAVVAMPTCKCNTNQHLLDSSQLAVTSRNISHCC